MKDGFPNGSFIEAVTLLEVWLCAKVPNGEVICCDVNVFVVVVVLVTFVEPNGELFISPNVDDVNGVVLDVPKVTPVFRVPNVVLEDVAAVGKVSLAVPVVIPNVGFEKAAVLFVSNCEVAVAKGLVVVEGVMPNGNALEVEMAGVVPWAFPNMFTEGVEVPKAFVGCAVLKAGVVVFDPPNIPPEFPNVGFSPNIEPELFPKVAEPPKTGAPPKAGVSDCENIPELKVLEDGVTPNMELVVCKFEEPPNGLAVEVLAPVNIEALDWEEVLLNREEEEVAPLLNTDVDAWDVCLAKTLFTWLDVPNMLGCPKTGWEAPPPKIEPDEPKVCVFCPILNVEVFVIPNIELVLVPPPNTPKLLLKVGVLPNTGFEVVVVFPKIDVLLVEVKPPLNGLFWFPNVLFPNTEEDGVLLGCPSWGVAKAKLEDFPDVLSFLVFLWPVPKISF